MTDANLSPASKRAERASRDSQDDDTRLVAQECMLSTIPKHMGTKKMQTDLKSRIARARAAQERGAAKKGGRDLVVLHAARLQAVCPAQARPRGPRAGATATDLWAAELV